MSNETFVRALESIDSIDIEAALAFNNHFRVRVKQTRPYYAKVVEVFPKSTVGFHVPDGLTDFGAASDDAVIIRYSTLSMLSKHGLRKLVNLSKRKHIYIDQLPTTYNKDTLVMVV